VLRISNDTDGDGLWDDWERFGIDTNGDGTIDLDLPGLGANPRRKNLFVEIDFMDCATAGSDCAAGDNHSHRPSNAAVNAVIQAFANANIGNPDGSNGITLRVDVSNTIPHQNVLFIPNACFTGAAGSGFDAVKADANNFGPNNARRFAYHYGLFTHRQQANSTVSGCAELPGNDFQVSLGGWNYFCAGGPQAGRFCASNANCPGGSCQAGGDLDGDGVADQDVGTVQQQAGTFLHEFGHNLNLGHGGGDWTNFKPNYLSVMNYTFQMGGIPPLDPDGAGPLGGRVDLSPSLLATLVETNLSEPAGIGNGADNTTFTCPNGNPMAAAGNRAIDWNCDADGGTDLGVSSDINADMTVPCVTAGGDGVLSTAAAGDDVAQGLRILEGPNRQCDTTAAANDVQFRPLGPLTGYWDWNNLKFDFHTTRDFEDGVHTPSIQVIELPFETYGERLAPDPALVKTASPNPVVTGSNITYTLAIGNSRPTAAANVTVADNLPATTTFVSCNSTGGGICAGAGNNRTISFPSLPGGGSATITLVATANCPVPHGTLIGNTATASAVSDADPSNNSATAAVTASNPPPAISNAAVSRPELWPPNHRMVEVAVRYSVTDNCGPVACALSVTSNEPVEGTGDGDTAPDWEILDAHSLRLRAERAGAGNGRVYTITITCTDSSGNSSSRSVTVRVLHSQG